MEYGLDLKDLKLYSTNKKILKNDGAKDEKIEFGKVFESNNDQKIILLKNIFNKFEQRKNLDKLNYIKTS